MQRAPLEVSLSVTPTSDWLSPWDWDSTCAGAPHESAIVPSAAAQCLWVRDLPCKKRLHKQHFFSLQTG